MGRISAVESPVRKFRRRLKLSQAEFAAELGVAQHTVSRWENGRNISHRFADKIFDRWPKKLSGKARLELMTGRFK